MYINRNEEYDARRESHNLQLKIVWYLSGRRFVCLKELRNVAHLRMEVSVDIVNI